jgi:hypothetical protein
VIDSEDEMQRVVKNLERKLENGEDFGKYETGLMVELLIELLKERMAWSKVVSVARRRWH